MSRWPRTASAMLLAALLAASGCSDDEIAENPVSLADALPPAPGTNVLIISFDALRQDVLGVYGNERGMTPNMDAFAAEAVVFENAYTVGQATASSFAAAFTGKLPFKVLRKWALIDTTTIADVFKSAGYRTGGVFNNGHLVPERNYQQGFDVYHVMGNQHDNEPLELIREFLRKRSDKPFFAWVHFINPHSPYSRRELMSQFYTDGYEGPFSRGSGGRVQSYKPEEMPEADLTRIRELYRGEVYFADYRFGQVIRFLRKRNLLENTLVVVTADHGEAMVEHGQFGHSKLYEEVIRIPLLMRHPLGPRGKRIQTNVMNVDLLPTLSAIAGIDFPKGLDGANLTDTFDAARPIIAIEMTNPRYHSMAYRKGNMKFFAWCGRRRYWEELFDLEKDPAESDNLVGVDPALAGDLFLRLREAVGGDPCEVIEDAIGGVGKFDNVDRETIKQLRSLGYIQ